MSAAPEHSGARAPGSDAGDEVGRITTQWAVERPDLDVTPMAIFGRIAKIHRAQLRASEEAYREFDLSHGDFDVLATLRRSGAPYRLTPSDLTGQMMISSGGVTQRVDRLCKLGLVERVPHETDRRSTTVSLTATGRQVIDRAVPLHVEAERALLAPLSPAEQRTLVELLARLAAGME